MGLDTAWPHTTLMPQVTPTYAYNWTAFEMLLICLGAGPSNDYLLEYDSECDQALNFVVYGTMSFTIGDKTYDCKDFRVGQGHHGFDNNWWVGSSECVTIPDSEVYKCKCGAWLPTSEQVT